MIDKTASPEITAMLSQLHRGGAWSYWWTDHGRESVWWEVETPAPIPESWNNVYFGIHATSSKGGQHERSKIATIAAINCLFAEFDSKDFPGGKSEALNHVTGLPVLPSVLVDSGGGYHGYWLLQDVYPLETEQDRKRAQAIQAAWVKYTGGDPGAKDLARVLRLPGSLNHKYDPPRPVGFIWADYSLLHDLNELEALSNAGNRPQEAPRAPRAGNNGRSTTDPGSYWLKQAVLKAHAGSRNETGLWLAAQLRDSGLARGEAESVMLDYANQAPAGDHPYTSFEALASLASAYSRPPREAATLPGSNGGQIRAGVNLSAAPDLDSEPGPIPNQGSLTDTANADRLARRHGAFMRWVNEWGWLTWDGKRWAIDQKEIAMRYAKQTARNIYQEAAQADDDSRAKDLASWAGKSLNRSRLDNMLYLAQSELQARTEDFDLNPWLLNVGNGILDLQTGKLSTHEPKAHITKIAGADYDPGATCPTWERFLDRIFSGNQDLVKFIQRAAGYSLTGDVSEQVFFFLYGTGANGKSTFANAIHDIMLEYGMKARAEVLMLRRYDAIPEETAQIAGVRFMLAAELGEGQRLNEPLIKDLTGGDKLRARLLYRKSFEFYPMAKVWLYGNHKPAVYGTDEGIWRRPKLIPFAVKIPEGEQDKRLPEKLRAELPGILTWAVRGCLEWQRQGLNPPEAVNAATREFRAEQDLIGQFIGDCCLISELATVTAGELYEAYKAWADNGGVTPKSRFVFARQLEERGHSTTNPDGSKRRDIAGRAYYTGLGLLGDASNE